MDNKFRETYEGFKNQPFAMTVKGPITPDKLGKTLIHEHAMIDYSFGQNLEIGELPVGQTLWPLERFEEAYDRVEASGFGTIIDAMPGGGCDGVAAAHPLLLRLLADRTNLNIVKPLGFYTADQVPMPVWTYPPTEKDELIDILYKQMKYGIGYSGVKPGFLKLGVGPHMADIERFWQSVLVEIQKETGMYIYVHTQETKAAEEVLDGFIENGADLSKCEIGHVGWGIYENAKERHIELLKSGVSLGFDNIGNGHRPVSDYVDMVYDLIEAGYEKQIFLSQDTIAVNYGWNGAWGMDEFWCHGNSTVVQRRVLPALKERGVSDETLHTIVADNPKRMLSLDPVKHEKLKDTLLYWRPNNDEHVGGDWSKATGHRVGIDKFYEPK